MTEAQPFEQARWHPARQLLNFGALHAQLLNSSSALLGLFEILIARMAEVHSAKSGSA